MRKVIPSDAVLVPDRAKRVFKGVIYDVYHWPQILFDGSKITYEMLRRPDTIDVLCIVDDRIIVLDDTQPHQGTITTLPSGKVDLDDSSTLMAARREVVEETGYTFHNWKLVGVRQFHAKTEWFIYTYLAWKVAKLEKPKLDPGEKITVNLMPFDKVKEVAAKEKGYMGETRFILDQASDVESLLLLPEYKGQEVDR